MKYGKMAIFILTVFLAVLAVAGISQEPEIEEEVTIPLRFSVKNGDVEELISCWDDGMGSLYVFLPGYAQMEDVYFRIDSDQQIIVGDCVAEDKMSCASYRLNEEYGISVETEDDVYCSLLRFVKSGDVPTMYIDVASGTMDYIHLEKTNQESGQMRLYEKNGVLSFSGEIESIKGRGNTTWFADKKPYNITLSNEADLLDMGAAQKWILLAEGHNDNPVRNKIVYDFASSVGIPYTPDTRWVDLYLNGEYAGLYLLSERNEIHPERVDIPQENSFLVSMESERLLNEQGIAHVLTASERALRIRSTYQDHWQIQTILQSVENAILSETGIDSITGKHWRELIDMDSWVRKYLIEEVFANPDGGAVSQYFYYDGSDPTGRVFAGPVWDYDYAMGGEDYWLGEYTAFFTMNRMNSKFSNYISWFYPLYHSDVFYQRLTEIYEQEFLPRLNELLSVKICEYAEELQYASVTNQIRWGIDAGSLEREMAFICAFLEKRMEFLSDIWIGGTEYCTAHVNIGRYYDAHFAVKPGCRIPDIPEHVLSDGVGWYRMDTEEPFDIAQPIYEDVSIYYREAETAVPVISFFPIAGLLFVGMVVLLFDYMHSKRSGVRNDPAKVK